MSDLSIGNHECLEGGKRSRSPNVVLNLVSGVVPILTLGDGVIRHPCGVWSRAVQVPGMNGQNTRGLLVKGLSAPVTPAVFGPFMPGTCNCAWSAVKGAAGDQPSFFGAPPRRGALLASDHWGVSLISPYPLGATGAG